MGLGKASIKRDHVGVLHVRHGGGYPVRPALLGASVPVTVEETPPPVPGVTSHRLGTVLPHAALVSHEGRLGGDDQLGKAHEDIRVQAQLLYVLSLQDPLGRDAKLRGVLHRLDEMAATVFPAVPRRVPRLAPRLTRRVRVESLGEKGWEGMFIHPTRAYRVRVPTLCVALQGFRVTRVRVGNLGFYGIQVIVEPPPTRVGSRKVTGTPALREPIGVLDAYPRTLGIDAVWGKVHLRRVGG